MIIYFGFPNILTTLSTLFSPSFSPGPPAAPAARQRARQQSDHPGVPGVLPPRPLQRRHRGQRQEPPSGTAPPSSSWGGQRGPLQGQAQEDHLRELCVREEARVQDVLVRARRGAAQLRPRAAARALPVELRHPGALHGQGGGDRDRDRPACPPACPPSSQEEGHDKHVHHQVHEEAQGCRAGESLEGCLYPWGVPSAQPVIHCPAHQKTHLFIGKGVK